MGSIRREENHSMVDRLRVYSCLNRNKESVRDIEGKTEQKKSTANCCRIFNRIVLTNKNMNS